MEEKVLLRLTFNPGLTLTSFILVPIALFSLRTIRPWREPGESTDSRQAATEIRDGWFREQREGGGYLFRCISYAHFVLFWSTVKISESFMFGSCAANSVDVKQNIQVIHLGVYC